MIWKFNELTPRTLIFSLKQTRYWMYTFSYWALSFRNNLGSIKVINKYPEMEINTLRLVLSMHRESCCAVFCQPGCEAHGQCDVTCLLTVIDIWSLNSAACCSRYIHCVLNKLLVGNWSFFRAFTYSYYTNMVILIVYICPWLRGKNMCHSTWAATCLGRRFCPSAHCLYGLDYCYHILCNAR